VSRGHAVEEAVDGELHLLGERLGAVDEEPLEAEPVKERDERGGLGLGVDVGVEIAVLDRLGERLGQPPTHHLVAVLEVAVQAGLGVERLGAERDVEPEDVRVPLHDGAPAARVAQGDDAARPQQFVDVAGLVLCVPVTSASVVDGSAVPTQSRFVLTLGRIVSRLPAWVVVVIAVACVVLGAVLTFRPFTSVDVLVLVAGLVAIVTGALTIVSDEEERSPAYRWLVGVGWIVLGVVVLAWPGLTVEALAVVVGVALVVNGLLDIVRALTGRAEEWAAELIGGLATVIFGVLALTWPDVTVFVVAVLFGARTVLFGSLAARPPRRSPVRRRVVGG